MLRNAWNGPLISCTVSCVSYHGEAQLMKELQTDQKIWNMLEIIEELAQLDSLAMAAPKTTKSILEPWRQ